MNWIKIEDKKPQVRQRVLIKINKSFGGGIWFGTYLPKYSDVYYDYGQVFIAELEHGKTVPCKISSVTHWAQVIPPEETEN